jgi:hypothetical protein
MFARFEGKRQITLLRQHFADFFVERPKKKGFPVYRQIGWSLETGAELSMRAATPAHRRP